MQNDCPKLYRAMQVAMDSHPEIGMTARTLGARPHIDILIQGAMVYPNTGGISVAPDDPMNLPSHRRPPSFMGTGKDPVWRLNACDLGPELQYRPDPRSPTTHGFIEPIAPTTFDEYQRALEATRESWQLTTP
jgi:hypothetical protein